MPVNFTSGDLLYAVGNAKAYIGGKKAGIKWRLQVKVKDIYDFTEIRTFKLGISVANLANDLGYVLQKSNYITKYSWSAQFSLTI